MNRTAGAWLAMSISLVLMAWVVIKASILGFYLNEIVPELVVPGAIGLAFCGLAKLLDAQVTK